MVVREELYPCHIASLPVAVNIQCHAARKATARFDGQEWEFLDLGVDVEVEVLSKELQGFKRVLLPLSREEMAGFQAGQWLLLSGRLYTARDQTHRILVSMLEQGQPLPVDLKGELIYYVGPSPAPEGRPIGSAGPTTSYRMDAFTPALLKAGVKATMGKGQRGEAVREAMREYGAIYLGTLGGAGAYLSKRIKRCQVVAFQELGPEALFEMEVEDFPAVVINDLAGNDYYQMLKERSA